VETVPPRLASELVPGQYVALSVSDTGTGMSPTVLARAFEPFFTTKEQGKGTGLGLAQLYGFAKQSGGTARIESKEGEGTTVTIYLPRTRQECTAQELAEAQQRPAERARILVVDDDDDVRMVAAAMIEEIGYEVVAVESGAAALQAMEADRFGLLVTDVAMPGMSGVELTRQARQIAPEMPVIFASGYADVQTFGSELADEPLLKKPYRIAEVAARIAAALSQQRREGNVIEFRR
jgi:CheY-like chemotaxis protein